MNFRMRKLAGCFAVLLTLLSFCFLPLSGQAKNNSNSLIPEMEQEVQKLMEKGDIPGLSLVLVEEGRPVYIKCFGYTDAVQKKPVTPSTLFELASISKAFTALAVVKLESEGRLKLDDPVAKYIDGFFVTFKGNKVPITLRHALNHTTGIPFKTVALIPRSNAGDAIQQTVRNLSGTELARFPGMFFEYATINYDILGAVIEKVTGMSYEAYMAANIFTPLGLKGTRIGCNIDDPRMATGHRISFYKPRAYVPPPYRGNAPAGYILSNAEDMALWLQYHLGLLATDMQAQIEKTHEPNNRVLPNPPDSFSYAMGWNVHPFGLQMIEHSGMNPNFSSYIAFKPLRKTGVVVLANSNSGYTIHIGDVALSYWQGRPYKDPDFKPMDTLDGTMSIVCIVLALYILLVFAYLIWIVLDIKGQKRSFEKIDGKKILKLVGTLVAMVPVVVGIYLLPLAMRGVPWEVASVWSSYSFQLAAKLIIGTLVASYIGFLFSSFFPTKNFYLRSMPMLVLLSLISGGANAVVIFLITSSIFTDMKLVYQVYFYIIAFCIYVFGRKTMQTRMTQMSFRLVYDMRMRLANKVFLTSYQHFEKLERGRVFATLNDDAGLLGQSAGMVVGLVTSAITAICAFVYLSTIAFWATMVTLGVIVALAVLYSSVSASARKHFERARDTRNTYLTLLNGLLDGFKELSLRITRKKEYRKDLDKVTFEFINRMMDATIKFINAFMVGESILLLTLASVSFAVPHLFPSITRTTLMSFIMVLLYLIGPVTALLNGIPTLTQIQVAWGRVKQFERDTPANIDPAKIDNYQYTKKKVDRIVAKGVMYKYDSKNPGEEGFSVGPIDFEARKGEITFIIGGNGSGKTTFAKLLTGLYAPMEGTIKVEGESIDSEHLGEHFSAVYSNFHLFERMYDTNIESKKEIVDHYLKLLHLQDKVIIKNNAFSTIDLSGGQRKRLALLECYLEDAPIYLFDEVAADQDPEFRKFFYRDLLKRMKDDGKIVIAITHDDHYFDLADQIVKFDMGKLDIVDASYRTTAAES